VKKNALSRLMFRAKEKPASVRKRALKATHVGGRAGSFVWTSLCVGGAGVDVVRIASSRMGWQGEGTGLVMIA
jgi:hypothetical protein